MGAAEPIKIDSTTPLGIAAGTTPTREDRRDDVVRAEIRLAVEDAFGKRDFAKLEQMASSYLADRSRTPSGVWKLTVFYGGLGTTMERASKSDVDWTAIEQKMADWVKQYPNSPAARIAYAEALDGHAWFFRGFGSAGEVAADAWPKFRKYQEKARARLLADKKIASKDPAWYEFMLRLANAQGWSRKAHEALLAEALSKEPEYYPSYFAAALYHSPKWHGDMAQLEKFADDATKRTQRSEGKSMYARIYWAVLGADCDCDFIMKKSVDWPKLKVAFDDLISRYPESWNLNNYARFACMAGDKDTTRSLIDRIGQDVVRDVWPPASFQEQCWELAGLPSPIRRAAPGNFARPKYLMAGNIRPTCPLTLPGGFSKGPGLTISMDEAVQLAHKASGNTCESMFLWSVYVDAENYYITKPGGLSITDETPAIIVDGKTGVVSFRKWEKGQE